MVLSTRVLLVFASAILPAVATAEPMSLSLRPGIASREVSTVAAGPSLGIEARLPFTDQLAVALVASASEHGVDPVRGGGGQDDIRLLGGGLSWLFDRGSVLPFIEGGVTGAWRKTQSTSFDPWPYAGVSVLVPRGKHLRLGFFGRYAIQIANGQTSTAYVQAGFCVDWLIER